MTGTPSLPSLVLQKCLELGVTQFVICPGGRCAPLIYTLHHLKSAVLHYWPEERSAAFFALGKIKSTESPVAVITTSGTAVAEVFPAVIEAYYSSLPLIVISADRPRRFRGSGAPQSIEQEGLFRHYAGQTIDLEEGEDFSFAHWNRLIPLHLNLCLEEFAENSFQIQENIQSLQKSVWKPPKLPSFCSTSYDAFLKSTTSPLVVVGALKKKDRKSAIKFLIAFGAPIYLEASSGLREEESLQFLQIHHIPPSFSSFFDGVLRIGGIPTHRLWRDLEYLKKEVNVYSVTDLPFSGLSWGEFSYCDLSSFFSSAPFPLKKFSCAFDFEADRRRQQQLLDLFEKEPCAEPALIHKLSKIIQNASVLYLGNSSPIREWDLAATYAPGKKEIFFNRGANGIDGQISTFLGTCKQHANNWAIIGDLTALYDLAGFWITPQLADVQANLLVINNQGGKIFKRMFSLASFMNSHSLCFEHLAHFWGWKYERWTEIPQSISEVKGFRLIELVPDEESTDRFFESFK